MSESDKSKPRVLVVEDDPTSCELMSVILGGLTSVEIAMEGESALVKVKQSLEEGSSYSAILLDVMLPGMDGYQILEQIRHLESQRGIVPGSGAKIIMISSRDDESAFFDSFTGGCDAYLVKPIKRAELVSLLKDLGVGI